MNSNTEVPVQMVMPELNPGQPMQNENANSSSQSNAVMHPTMTMAQSPLQQQMQAMQQNLNSNSTGSVQMVMSDLNTQVQMVQNENIAHSGSSTQPTLMHQTGTMAQTSMQHVQVIPQAMSAPYFQSMYSPQQQVIFPGNLTLHTGTSPMVQSITQNPNVQLQAKPELLNKVSVTGPTYQIVNAVTTKGFPTQNLIAKPMYSSSVNVNSPTQVSNANQLKQITSQPQMITTQASSGAIYQPQIFGPFTQLPQNLTWATPGTYQSPTLLSANVIIRNQQPEMLFQHSPQTAMIMPVGAGTAQLPGGFTYALVQPQKPQQITQKHLSVPQTQMQKTVKVVRNISPSVATQTNVNEKMKIAIPRTRVNQNIVRPKGKFTVPLQYNTALSSILPQQVTTGITTDAQSQVQLGFQLEPTTQLDATNQILPNQIKSTASTETDTSVLQNQVVSSEIPQPFQHLLSKPEIINTPTSIAQMTTSAVGKPVGMVIASTVNTSLSVVTSPTFVTPGLTPVVSSVETPVSVPPSINSIASPPTSSSVLSDKNVLDSASNSVPLPETNSTNEENIIATVSNTQDITCDSSITNCLKPIDKLIVVSETKTIDNSTEHIATDTSKPQTQVTQSEPKIVNVLKSQSCSSEYQTTPVSVKTHVSVQKKVDKLVFEKSQHKIKCFTNNELTTNILKPEKQAKTNITMSDVSVPKAHVRDCVQGKDENSKDKTEFNLDIVIKKEPVDSSPAKIEKENNSREVAEKQVVLNQADSSVSIKNDHGRHQFNSIHTGPVQQPPLSLAPTVENIISQTDVKNKTVDSEIHSVITTEKKSVENKTSDSKTLENKTEESVTDSKVSLNESSEQVLISKQFDEKEGGGDFLKNLEKFIEQEKFSIEKSDIVPQNVISSCSSHIMGKQKQRLKAVVRPHILTHVIDGFVIYESSEPFPVNKSALMSDSCTPVIPKIADNSKKHKGSKQLSAKNPDEPTKPDDLKEPNEPAKTDFPKKRNSDRIKLMETQKQLDLKKSEPKKPNDLKKVIEPKTPTEKKTIIDIKKEDEPKKLEDPKKIDESNTGNDATPPNDLKKPDQAVSENIPKTPGRRGRKRKELRSRRGRKKLIPDNELNTSNIEIIVIDEDNGPEFDAPEDESSPAPKTPPPVQTADVDEAHKSPIEDEKSKQPEKASEEKIKDTEANKKKRFNEKLPTEWSVEDVCDFVRNIPNCQDYAEEFRSQEIDGKALLLLKVDHIVTFTSMKFGPALKLISLIDDMKEKYSLEV